MTDSKRIDRKDAEVLGTLTATVSMALDGLSDVDASSPSDGDALTWVDAHSAWEPVAGSGGTPTAITVADESSDTSCYPAFFTAATGDLGPKTDASALTYNASTGALGATTFVGALTGNVTGDCSGSSGSCSGNALTATSATSATSATDATNAANIGVADESSDTSCFPVFVTGNTGNLPPKVDAYLTYNASTGAMGATRFNGLADAQVLTTAADTTTTLDSTYASDLLITGTAVMQVYNLGTATGYGNGKRFTFYNNTPEFVGVLNGDSTVWHRVPPRAKCTCFLADNSTAAGVWFSEVCESKDPCAGLSAFNDYNMFANALNTASYEGLYIAHAGSGTGARIGNSSINTGNNGIGVMGFETGTTNSGYQMSYTPHTPSLMGGYGPNACEARIILSDLSTVAEEYIARVGMGDNITGGAHTGGCYFLYDRATNGDFWAIKNINASGNATTVTAVAPSASAYQKMRVEVSSASTRVDYFINKVAVSGTGGVSTYIPAAVASSSRRMIGITKTAGTTERILYADYLWLQFYPTTLR